MSMMHGGRIVTVFLALAILAPPPSLHGAWVANGVAICVLPNTHDTPTIAADGSGGAIIVWRDGRVGVNTDIYAQRVDPAGSVLWTANGTPVCTAFNSQSLPLAVSDGAGGVIVAWQDFRGGSTTDIYAQRVNSSGYIQWTADGVSVCTGKTGLALSQTIPDGSGGALIVWSDTRNATNDIFIQRINSSGTALWTANGVTVCAASASQVVPAVASDGAGGAIVAWRDSRGGASDIYAQRLSAAGAVQWTADGVVVCNVAQAQLGVQIVSDASGGAFIAWTDHRNTVDDDIYAQRVDGNGVPQWTANGIGIVSSMTGKQSDSRIVRGAANEAIIAWLDLRSGTTEDIYAQKVDTAGATQWTANGIPVCTAANRQIAMQLISNGSGGAIATWQDERGSSGVWDIYAQRTNGDGTMGWTANGVVVSAATLNQTAPQLAPDGVGGAIITWKDERSGNADIYAQRVDAAGHTIVATLLQDYSVAANGPEVGIAWTLSEAGGEIEFFVLRAQGASVAFAEIAASGTPGSYAGTIVRNGLSFSFSDETCVPGETYRYRVDVRDGGERRVLFETAAITTPELRSALYQNHPNPFNPSTTIRYYLRDTGAVALEIYDANGSLVRRLENRSAPGGLHAVEWNGLDDRGNQAGSGVYFCRLRAGKETLSRTMILLR
jgi:hypothetical protein